MDCWVPQLVETQELTWIGSGMLFTHQQILKKKKKKDDNHVPEWKYVQGKELAQIEDKNPCIKPIFYFWSLIMQNIKSGTVF